MEFLKLPDEMILSRLTPKEGILNMVLDTDAYNEIDDQFALAYALRSTKRLNVEAVYAAPFHNNRSDDPKDGMNKSYDEIINVFKLMEMPFEGKVYKGSTEYLTDQKDPERSDAVMDLVKRAMTVKDGPLYVVAIGAITNIASAILIEPGIIKNIVIVWLGGHALNWLDTSEFNLRQDVISSRIIFDCGVPIVLVPCYGVVSHLHTTVQELTYHLYGKSKIGTYLVDIVKDCQRNPYGGSKVIWDVAAIAWLIDSQWLPTNIVHSPIVTDQLTWSFDSRRHFIRSAYYIHRDPIFADMFKKLVI